jgi:hypothetical protein
MGIVQKSYCDTCGIKLDIIGYRLVIKEVFSSELIMLDLGLCGDCYSKLLDFFKVKQNKTEKAWEVPEVIPEVIDL